MLTCVLIPVACVFFILNLKNKYIPWDIAGGIVIVLIVLWFSFGNPLPGARGPYSVVISEYEMGMDYGCDFNLGRMRMSLDNALHLEERSRSLAKFEILWLFYKPDVNTVPIDDAIEALNGGNTDFDSLKNSFNEGGKQSIHYMIGNGSMIRSTNQLNAFSDGVILLLERESGIFKCIRYQCQGCFDDLAVAMRDDITLEDNLEYDRKSSYVEYYDFNCDGEQVNDWWQESYNDNEVPWTLFREFVILVIHEADANGERISYGEYQEELQEREGE